MNKCKIGLVPKSCYTWCIAAILTLLFNHVNIFKTYDFFKKSFNDDIKMKSMKMNLLKDASVVLQASSWGRKTVGGKAGRPVYLGTWRPEYTGKVHRTAG